MRWLYKYVSTLIHRNSTTYDEELTVFTFSAVVECSADSTNVVTAIHLGMFQDLHLAFHAPASRSNPFDGLREYRSIIHVFLLSPRQLCRFPVQHAMRIVAAEADDSNCLSIIIKIIF